MTIHADYSVVGVGSAGSFALRALAQAGHNAIGLEAAGVANDRCAVGGDTRLFRRLYLEGLAYHPLLERAREIWQELNESEPDSFVQTGALSILDANSPDAEALTRYGETFGLDFEVLENTRLCDRFPQFSPREDAIGFYDPSGGYVRTDVVVRRAAADAVAAGARILDARAYEILPDDAGVTIVTDSETVRCEKVIVAAGARSRMLLPSLAEVTKPKRISMTWYQTTEAQLFDPSRCPVFCVYHPDYYVYGAPALDGRHVKVSGMIEDTFIDFDGFDYDSTITREMIRESAAKVFDSVQGVHPVPVRTGVYPDLYTTDHDFILDFVDEDKRIFAATGFSGKGFKMSSALGEHAAQVITGDAELLPAFSLGRFPD